MIASAAKKPQPRNVLIERKFMGMTLLKSRSSTSNFLCNVTEIVICMTLFSAKPLGAAEPSSAAVTAVNTFGIDLLHKIAKSDGNALISPYSIQSALAMAYAGADGTTRAEMAKVLHYPKDESELHQSLAA